jgi:hypothetical protein
VENHSRRAFTFRDRAAINVTIEAAITESVREHSARSVI